MPLSNFKNLILFIIPCFPIKDASSCNFKNVLVALPRIPGPEKSKLELVLYYFQHYVQFFLYTPIK